MKLVELLKDVEVLECTAQNHTEITGVCCDSLNRVNPRIMLSHIPFCVLNHQSSLLFLPYTV